MLFEVWQTMESGLQRDKLEQSLKATPYYEVREKELLLHNLSVGATTPAALPGEGKVVATVPTGTGHIATPLIPQMDNSFPCQTGDRDVVEGAFSKTPLIPDQVQHARSDEGMALTVGSIMPKTGGPIASPVSRGGKRMSWADEVEEAFGNNHLNPEYVIGLEDIREGQRPIEGPLRDAQLHEAFELDTQTPSKETSPAKVTYLDTNQGLIEGLMERADTIDDHCMEMESRIYEEELAQRRKERGKGKQPDVPEPSNKKRTNKPTQQNLRRSVRISGRSTQIKFFTTKKKPNPEAANNAAKQREIRAALE